MAATVAAELKEKAMRYSYHLDQHGTFTIECDGAFACVAYSEAMAKRIVNFYNRCT